MDIENPAPSLDLVPAPQPGTLLSPEVLQEFEALVAASEDLIDESWAPTTVDVYTRHWNRFVAWCDERSVPVALPVPPELLQLYFASWGTKDPAPSWTTLNQAMAGIAWIHTREGVPAPSSVRLTQQMKGLRRRLGTAPQRQAAPLRLEHMRAIGERLREPTRAQVRDAVVIALRAMGWTYGEIVGVEMRHLIEVTPKHCVLETADGTQRRYDARAGEGCVVAAVQRWMPVRGGWPGPVAVRVNGKDEIVHEPIPRQTVRHIVNRWSERAGLSSGVGLSAATADALIACALSPRPSAVRDVAVIGTLWAGGLRSDELVRLRVGDIRIDERGMTLSIRSSKTDQEGKGQEKVIPRGRHAATDPVEAMSKWLDILKSAGATPQTPVFVAIDRGDNLVLTEVNESGDVRPVSPSARSSITLVLREALQRSTTGLDISAFSSHSGKRGIATELANSGADVRAIMTVTGHKSADTAMVYIDEVDRWSNSALRLLDL